MKRSAKGMLAQVVRALIAPFGFTVTRLGGSVARTMADALAAIAARGHPLNTVIDVGASNGIWSRALMPYYPQCQYLLFEPQAAHAEALARFTREHRNVHHVSAAAGAAAGVIFFDASDPLGGQASYQPYSVNNVRVPVATLDAEVEARGLRGPFLVKLDTHGFEVPILKGAARTLAETEVIVMECYNFRIAPECLLFHEMCSHLQGLGFRCIDLADPMSRPGDQSFWQMDLVFVRESRPEFLRNSYR